MKKIVFISIVLCLFVVSGVFAQDPGDIIWSNSYGGNDKEYGYSMNLTTDGGYIMGGYSNSFGTGPTDNDVYLVKINADGDTLWTRTYGGIDTDKCKSVQQCIDGGYIIAGETNSFGAGNYDVYLIKTDANGDTLWTRTYGGSSIDRSQSVKETTDGGYILTGYTNSFGAGGKDVYLIKTNANGDTLWTRTYGAVDDEEGYSVVLTTDGGYIIAGFTDSFGAGGKDAYLIKTDANGDTLWTSTHGGTDHDRGYAVQQCNDGGYIIAGDTKSSGAGNSDYYLVKTDASGATLWTRDYGGSAIDIGYSLQQTPDEGYIIAGSTQSFNVGYFDIYLVRTDAIGDTLWTRTYGSYNYEHGRSVQLTTDGNYVVAGWTWTYGPGISAFWLLKIAGEGVTLNPPQNLAIECIEDYAHFTWEAPVGEQGFNDDFEAYDDFVLEFDPWTLVDVDECITYYIIGYTFPNQHYTGSYIIFNPSQVDPPLEDVVPHSGDKMAACFAASNPTYLNDDWMITPAITIAEGDEVSFFAKSYTDQYGLERFNVAVSTTGTTPADFTVISEAPYIEPPVDWTEYNFDLSFYAGQSVYVAIQCVTADAFIFFVDDFYVGPPTEIAYDNVPIMNGRAGREISEYIHGKITSADNTYELSFAAKNTDNPRSRDLLGYNVYLDGVLLGDTTDTEWVFTDLINGIIYTAGVEAVYDEGVSDLVEIDFEYIGLGAGNDIVLRTVLRNNYPNPFNPSTNIAFSLANTGRVTLEVFNIQGKKVKTLINEVMDADQHIITWNGNDNSGKSVATGVYFYKLKVNGKTEAVKKCLLLK